MRYRRLSYRYAEVASKVGSQILADFWSDRLSVALTQAQWRPAADLYETSGALIVKAELAGMVEEDFEITLYHDVLVIEGVRPWQPLEEETQFHVVAIHYGSFRLEVPLLIPLDRDRVEARYERGFLYITLPKAEGEAL